MNRKPFGITKEGNAASIYEIGNGTIKAVITDYGAAVVALYVPDKEGNPVDVVLGHDDVSGYEHNGTYFGATVAPNANRIAGAKCVIDGVTYELEANNGNNNLHSGANGDSWKIWEVIAESDRAITLRCTNKDLEQGFPGNSEIEVTYTVTEDNALAIDYKAVADKKTTFNMTNHSYFNLDGHDSGAVYDQLLQVKATNYTPLVIGEAVPTGEIVPVEDTPFDFRALKPIGEDIEKENEQLETAGGYDHNWLIDKTKEGVEIISVAYSEKTGICMETLSDLPGVQIYTANFVVNEPGKNGAVYEKRHAFCIETQYTPNAINDPTFAAGIFEAGEVCRTTTIYRFSVK